MMRILSSTLSQVLVFVEGESIPRRLSQVNATLRLAPDYDGLTLDVHAQARCWHDGAWSLLFDCCLWVPRAAGVPRAAFQPAPQAHMRDPASEKVTMMHPAAARNLRHVTGKAAQQGTASTRPSQTAIGRHGCMPYVRWTACAVHAVT